MILKFFRNLFFYIYVKSCKLNFEQMNFLFILSCFCPSAFVSFLKISFNISKLLILYLNLVAMLRSLPPSTQLTSLKRLGFSSKEKVFIHANLVIITNFYFKIFKLSFVKVSRGCFHLLNIWSEDLNVRLKMTSKAKIITKSKILYKPKFVQKCPNTRSQCTKGTILFLSTKSCA
jgi:hypothetical protein